MADTVATNESLFVVGGDITGMTAALESSRAGHEVLLVEKTAALGGYMAKLFKRVPFREPYADPQATGTEALAQSSARVHALPYASTRRRPAPVGRQDG